MPAACPKCKKDLDRRLYDTLSMTHCPNCGSAVRVDAFPAMFRPPEKVDPAAGFLFEDEAGCFNHPGKKAVAVCSSCGRFMCSLCDVEIGGAHVCPACVEAGRRERKIERLEYQRALHDRTALAVAGLPMFLVFPTIVTAPLALVLVYKYWNAPSSLVRSPKPRLIAAAVLALGQIALWGLYFLDVMKAV